MNRPALSPTIPELLDAMDTVRLQLYDGARLSLMFKSWCRPHRDALTAHAVLTQRLRQELKLVILIADPPVIWIQMT